MLQSRLTETPKLYTIGYERRDLEAFIDVLEAAGVEQVVDVRANAWSRKPGFSKTPLSEGLETAGLGYTHLPDLGAPKEIRGKGLSWQAFLEAYDDHLDSQEGSMDELEALARATPSAIMCLERKPEDCHRSALADHMAGRGLSIIHLE